MMKSSIAAAALCTWVKAIEEYAQALKVVNPKKAKMEAAMAKVAEMVAALQELEDRYSVMMKRLAEQTAELEILLAEMEGFKKQLAELSVKIDRGEMLVSGLGGEKIRWSAS
jgi:dynein heavy chain